MVNQTDQKRQPAGSSEIHNDIYQSRNKGSGNKRRLDSFGSCDTQQPSPSAGQRDTHISPWDSPTASNESFNLKNMASWERSPDLCAKILTATASKPYTARIRDDTGTDVNWIHPDLADACGLEREPCEPRNFRDFQRGMFKCTELVHVRWAGKDNKSIDGIFYVSPRQSAIELVLGEPFVRAHGRAHEFCAVEDVGNARILLSDTISKKEHAEMKKNEEKAKSDIALLESRRKGNSVAAPHHSEKKETRTYKKARSKS
ncbi:hypothetical protein BX600DRAFT_57796 [Xylariales sp. PMI_506]|nr:hypothetical protein BX600DRAFT_57796 [Xylariales sp. PMI_506]